MIRKTTATALLSLLLLPLLPPGTGATTTIATPTPAQARYQDTDFIALIHFNMGTYGERLRGALLGILSSGRSLLFGSSFVSSFVSSYPR